MRRFSWSLALVLCGFVYSLAGCTSNESKPTPVGDPGKPEQIKKTLESKDKDKEKDKEKDEDKKNDKP